MQIKQDIKSEFFKRQEIKAELKSEINPSFSNIKKKLSEKFSKPEQNIDVYNIGGGFGKNIFEISAYIYDSKEDLEKIKELTKTKKQKNEEKKAEEKTEEGESGEEKEEPADEKQEKEQTTSEENQSEKELTTPKEKPEEKTAEKQETKDIIEKQESK